MSTATITQVRHALANRFGAIPGDRTVYADIPSVWSAPCIAIAPHDMTEPLTFDGSRTLILDVYIYLPAQDSNLGQDQLDPFLSPTGSFSLEATVMVDPTLNQTVDCCTPNGWKQYGTVIAADKSPTGRQVIMAMLQFEVLM